MPDPRPTRRREGRQSGFWGETPDGEANAEEYDLEEPEFDPDLDEEDKEGPRTRAA